MSASKISESVVFNTPGCLINSIYSKMGEQEIQPAEKKYGFEEENGPPEKRSFCEFATQEKEDLVRACEMFLYGVLATKEWFSLPPSKRREERVAEEMFIVPNFRKALTSPKKIEKRLYRSIAKACAILDGQPIPSMESKWFSCYKMRTGEAREIALEAIEKTRVDRWRWMAIMNGCKDLQSHSLREAKAVYFSRFSRRQSCGLSGVEDLIGLLNERSARCFNVVDDYLNLLDSHCGNVVESDDITDILDGIGRDLN